MSGGEEKAGITFFISPPFWGDQPGLCILLHTIYQLCFLHEFSDQESDQHP